MYLKIKLCIIAIVSSYIVLYILNKLDYLKVFDKVFYNIIIACLSILSILFILLLICIPILLYFIPYLVAYNKKHINTNAILILNIFLGWTLIGWVVALIWSVKKEVT